MTKVNFEKTTTKMNKEMIGETGVSPCMAEVT
jgi:hypothetical protein